jgi:ADP-heptose:LPS heptosyltransferase
MRIYKANLMTLLPFIKTKYNVGYGVFGFGPLLDMEVKWIQGIHEVECFLECLKPFGINVALKDLSYELYPTNDDEIYVDKVIKENNLDNYIVIHPFSGAPERMLPVKVWVELIDRLGNKQIVICGTKAEIGVFNEIRALSHKKLVDLMGKFTVQQLYLFYKKATLIYSIESLSSHIAAMTGNKVISYYKCDPVHWGPVGQNVEVIRGVSAYIASADNVKRG